MKLGDLVKLVRGQLSKIQRAVLSALIVIEVHAKDEAAKMVEQEVSSINDFEWIRQLRFPSYFAVVFTSELWSPLHGVNVKHCRCRRSVIFM